MAALTDFIDNRPCPAGASARLGLIRFDRAARQVCRVLRPAPA